MCEEECCCCCCFPVVPDFSQQGCRVELVVMLCDSHGEHKQQQQLLAAAAAASMLAAERSNRTDCSAAWKSCGTDIDNELLWIGAKPARLYLLFARAAMKRWRNKTSRDSLALLSLTFSTCLRADTHSLA